MAWKLLIDGVDQTTNIRRDGAGSVAFTKNINERSTAQFTCNDGVLPDRFDEVLIYDQDGTTVRFGGIVMKRTSRRYRETWRKTLTDVQCADWWAYADWASTNLSYSSAVSLKTVLTDLVAECLSVYGITLDAGQVTGPTLEPFSFGVNARASDALRALTKSSNGYLVNISTSKVLSMALPGTVSAPFSVTDASPNVMSLRWSDSNRVPATRVVLRCGPEAPAWAFQDSNLFAADGIASGWYFYVADGVPYTVEGGGGTISVGGVIKNMAVGDFTWTLLPQYGFARLDLAAGAPTAGTIIGVTRNIQPPFMVIKDDATVPPIVEVVNAPHATTVSAAVQALDAAFTKLNAATREVSLVTRTSGLDVGQTLTINLSTAAPPLNTSVVITQVVTRLTTDTLWEDTVQATENYTDSELDQWRSLVGSDISYRPPR